MSQFLQRFRLFTGLVLLVSSLVFTAGCERTKQVAKDTGEGYLIAKDILGQAATLIDSFRTNDFSKAKEIGAEVDRVLESRAIGWHVDVLMLQEKSGSPAALEKVRELRQSEGITELETAALDRLEKFLLQTGNAKASETALDLLAVGCAVAVEAKYGKLGGHGALGGMGLQTREWLRTLRPSPAITSEATNAPGL